MEMEQQDAKTGYRSSRERVELLIIAWNWVQSFLFRRLALV